MRRRVLFLTRWYPSESKPAKGLFVREHARAASLNNDVVVLHLAGPDPSLEKRWKLEQLTDPLLTLGLPTQRVWYRPPRVPGTEYVRFITSGLRAIRALRRSGAEWDLIHAHEFDAGFVAMLSRWWQRSPFVVTEHSGAFPRGTLHTRAVFRARIVFRFASRVLPVSQALMKAIEAAGVRARFAVVPNTVDLGMFHPAMNRGQDTLTKRLTVVSRLNEVKGIPNLLDACEALADRRDDWHLDILGDGPGRAEYESRVRNAGLEKRVRFHGIQPRHEVARFLQQSDLHIVPSDQETFCVSAVEALACGTPVVATRSGGPEEFVTPDVGVLIPPRDSAALVDAIELALGHPFASREEISAYVAARFSHESVSARLDDIYQEVLHAVDSPRSAPGPG